MGNVSEKVENALNKIRPFIHADGGDIEFVKIEDNKVYVRFKGACVGCPLSMITLSLVVEEAIKEEIPEIIKVISVDQE